MFIGNRIRFIRKLKGLSQENIGLALGFSKATAEIRISQYETGNRIPRKDLTAAFSSVLDVSPRILAVPDIRDETGILCTLFALEDHYGLRISSANGKICLRFDNQDIRTRDLNNMLHEWLIQAKKLESGEIDKATYNHWRYNYPDINLSETIGSEVVKNEES